MDMVDLIFVIPASAMVLPTSRLRNPGLSAVNTILTLTHGVAWATTSENPPFFPDSFYTPGNWHLPL